MPRLSTNELERKIETGAIFAITIDTTVFDAKRRDLHNIVLRLLDRFIRINVNLVIADVVAREIKSHLRDEAKKTQYVLKRALRTHNTRWRRKKSEEEYKDLMISADPDAFSEMEFKSFLNHTGCEVLSSLKDPDSVRQIFDLYFRKEPPFALGEKRKSEFPDAFALATLEAYAAEEGKLLLCVSEDKGWIQFAERSEHLVCIPRLEEALALFIPTDQLLGEKVVQKWRDSNAELRVEVVYETLLAYLDNPNIFINADSGFRFYTEFVGAGIKSLEPDAIGQPHVLDLEDGLVTFVIEVKPIVWFEATFDFYVSDGAHDEHPVHLGSQEANIEIQALFELTITADTFFHHGLVFRDVDVTHHPIDVDFGHVDPF